jgi:hypothetical protein
MVDAAVSKTAEGNLVRVRLPLPAHCYVRDFPRMSGSGKDQPDRHIATEVATRVIVDPDDEPTWPAGLKEHLLSVPLDKSLYAPDQRVAPEAATRFLELLAGMKVRMYHCTRLLPHETDWVRADGLVPLTQELIARRVRAFADLYGVSETIRQAVHGQEAHAADESKYREGQVCLFLGSSNFDDPSSIENLLGAWGGEAVYRNNSEAFHGGDSMAFGTPTVVVAAVDLSADPAPKCFPEACNVFLGRLRGLEQACADVFLRRAVPPEDILEVWQPGCPGYDELLRPR